MMNLKSRFISLVSFAALCAAIFFAADFANAGECKVEDPTVGMMADGAEMARIIQGTLRKIEKEYKAKTGRTLEVVIVARAGQNLNGQTVLRDEEAGRLTSLQSIYEGALADRDSYDSNGNFSFTEYNKVVQQKYADSKRKLEFSHVGFMVRRHPNANFDEEGGGKWWWSQHMLRPCEDKNPETDLARRMNSNLNDPYIWNEGPGNFFADDPYELKARIIVPTPELQDRLYEVVMDKKIRYDLNADYYNAAASWQSQTENNSNQWILEMVAAASQPSGRVQTRAEAQDILRKMGYRPTKIHFTGQKAMAYVPGARKIAPYVTYHSKEQPYYFKGSIGEVITALSVEEFMQRNGMVQGLFSTVTIEKYDSVVAREKAEKKKAASSSSAPAHGRP